MKKFVICFLFLFVVIQAFSQYRKFSFQQPKMGSLFNIVIYAEDSGKTAKAAHLAYQLVDTLNEIYSDYLPTSELNKLCAVAGNKKWMKVSEPLYKVLTAAYVASEASGGSFDITAGSLVRLWRKARQQKILPDRDSIILARSKVSYKFIELDTSNETARLAKTGMQLDLGGIAKGETAQRVLDRLVSYGFPFSLIDAGGDIVAGQVPPGTDGWHVAINLPESEELMQYQLLLQNKAVTTSGDFYQHIKLNGKKYSHIINPLTGMALTNSRNVTVIADEGIQADWLTKACSVLPVKTALLLIKKYPGAELQIAMLKSGRPVYYRSRGFVNYLNR